jgi:hypothetical protein
MRRFVLALAFFCVAVGLRAQTEADSRQTIETLMDDLSDSFEEDADLEQIAEDLEYFAQNPINLNSATADDLAKLHFLNEFQIASLIEYVRQNGPMLTIYELAMVDGFDQTDAFRLVPFVTVSGAAEQSGLNVKRALSRGKNELFSRVTKVTEQLDGFADVSDSVRNASPEKYYPGNDLKIFSRYSFNYNRQLMAGITAEKDAGEQFFRGHQRHGFDYYSAYISVSDIGPVEMLIVGDFHARFGQGLVAWSGMSGGKSAFVMDIRKKGAGIRKYSSADENLFYRGVATTLSFGPMKVTAFGSHKKIDATLAEQDSAATGASGFTAFGTLGLHATPKQIEKEDAVTESVWGTNINFNRDNFRIGASALGYQFDKDYVKKPQPLYKFDFEGRKNLNVSLDAQYSFSAFYLFGEYAISANGGRAAVVGSLMSLAPGLRASVLYRNYSRDYQARYAGGFAEGGKTQNEEGFFFGIEATPIKRWKLSTYYDIYRFPWLRNGVNAPSRGNDFLVQADFAANRSTSMCWKFKIETCEKSVAIDSTAIQQLAEVSRWTARYHLNYAVNQRWTLKSRIELTGYKSGSSGSEKGCLLYQDVICTPFRAPLSFAFRYAIFETDSYNTRVSTYENDVLYAYSIPMMYGRGTRTYLLITWKPIDNLTIWARASRTSYADRDAIGTSPNKIDSNHKTELKLQIRWKF